MGVLRPLGSETTISLGSRCLIGRHPSCDVHLDHPRISGEHASLRWTGDRWELRDLGSRNGTRVNGAVLSAGGRIDLSEGSTFTLGGTELGFALVDGAPPAACARCVSTGRTRAAVNGMLVLPGDDDPRVTLHEAGEDQWVAEDQDATRPVADGEELSIAGDRWVVSLPRSSAPTMESIAGPTLDTIRLRLAVSRDEEHVEVTVLHGSHATLLPPRTHQYLLVTLARARLGDRQSSAADRGWVDRESLCRMLAIDLNRLNVDVFRVRKQIGDLGVHGAAGIIARRPGSGQLRLGTDRVEVVTL